MGLDDRCVGGVWRRWRGREKNDDLRKLSFRRFYFFNHRADLERMKMYAQTI